MRSMGERLSPAGVAMIVVAIAVFGWIGYELSRWPGEPPEPAGSITTGEDTADASAPEVEPGATATAPPEPQRFALLSDGLAVLPGSWFNRVVRNGADENVVTGAVASVPGSAAADLAPQAQQTARADVLVVQAGTIDLINGSAPNQVITDLQGLLQTAIDLGGPTGGPEVVWVTVPPLGAQPAAVQTVNEAVTTWAEENDVTVWDLTTPVATPAGGWRPGLTEDGIAASVAGQQAQAKAARALVAETLADLAAE